MPSPANASRFARLVQLWIRKGHFYLGLYFLFFLWLFSFTGLLLNHSWSLAEFWPNRRVSTVERPVRIPDSGSDLDRARALAAQLGLSGEIDWPAPQPASPSIAFRVSRPGRVWQVAVPAPGSVAPVEATEFNAWGVMRVLHAFTGVRAADPGPQRDWLLTSLWAWSMDALSAGLVLMVFSGIWLWLGLPARRREGLIALSLGTLLCAVFVFGLRWVLA